MILYYSIITVLLPITKVSFCLHSFLIAEFALLTQGYKGNTNRSQLHVAPALLQN